MLSYINKIKVPATIAAILICAAAGLSSAGFTAKQVVSSVIFLTILCGTLFYWKFRLAFAFSGMAALLATGLIDVRHMIEFAGLDIILFLAGMMTIIGFLEENNFFEYIVARTLDRVGCRPYLLVTILMVFSTLFAALVDEVTSILFMMSTTFYIAKRYKVSPVPLLLMVVFATNIGSSATAVGNPIGVMIALRGQLTFMDFLRWAAPISVAALAVTILLCFALFRKSLAELKEKMERGDCKLDELVHIKYTKTSIRICWALFLCTIFSLIMHHKIEEVLHLQKNSLLIGTALFFAGVALFLRAKEARELFSRRVDWWTLSFFLVLFASVGTLKYVGVTEEIAKALIRSAGGGNVFLLNIFTAAISLLTAFMDNVLAVATFIPVLSDISKIGVYIYPFWWAMLFGGTMFGNATVIGSTANIVAMGMLEKETGGHITFMQWLKPGLIVSIVTIVISMALLYAQIHLMPGAPARF